MYDLKIIGKQTEEIYKRAYTIGRKIGFEELKMIIESYATQNRDSDLLDFVQSLKIVDSKAEEALKHV